MDLLLNILQKQSVGGEYRIFEFITNQQTQIPQIA